MGPLSNSGSIYMGYVSHMAYIMSFYGAKGKFALHESNFEIDTHTDIH